MNVLRKLAASIAARKEKIILWAKKLSMVAAGHSLKQLEEIVVDHVIYGVVAAASLKYMGPVYGPFVTFAVMTPITAYLCLKYIKFYDKSQKDWFGFEELKDATSSIKSAWIRKALEKSETFGFIFWCINGDAFMVTVYCRKKENRYDGLTPRDKKIFWAAILFSNGWWTIRWYVIMWAFYFWQQISDFVLSFYHEGVWFLEVILPRLLT